LASDEAQRVRNPLAFVNGAVIQAALNEAANKELELLWDVHDDLPPFRFHAGGWLLVVPVLLDQVMQNFLVQHDVLVAFEIAELHSIDREYDLHTHADEREVDHQLIWSLLPDPKLYSLRR
jgi:hypothetical protein